MPLTFAVHDEIVMTVDYEKTEKQILALLLQNEGIGATIDIAKAALPGKPKLAIPMKMEAQQEKKWKTHSSYCKCSDCKKPEAKVSHWLTERSSTLVAMHQRFNPKDATFDPELVEAMLRDIGHQVFQMASNYFEQVLWEVRLESTNLRARVAQRDMELEQLKKEMETKKVTVSAVPDTDGRVFREE